MAACVCLYADVVCLPVIRSPDLDANVGGVELSGAHNSWPGWQSSIRSSPGRSSDRDEMAPTMDSIEEESLPQSHPSFEYFVSQHACRVCASACCEHLHGDPVPLH